MESSHPTITRRSFLYSALALSACQSTGIERKGSFWGPNIGHLSRWSPENISQNQPSEADVLIVGAGVSGLMAAWRLYKSKKKIELEAQD